MMQKLVEVGTHEMGHQSNFVVDKALHELDTFKNKMWFNAHISVIPMGVYVTSGCARKYCINILMDWL